MSNFNETIAALSTPVGTSAIAVVRASGPLCRKIHAEQFPASPAPRPRAARHGDYRSVNGTLIDDVVSIFYLGPQSYTGEDMLEISCHGNPLIAQKILSDLFSRGCVAAEPGEFTRRAFVNGRIDLSQAEAVADLIEARSERALSAANQQLRGSLGRRLAELTEELLSALARVEAYIDFPDEDLPPEDRTTLRSAIEKVSSGAAQLLATQEYGALLREGVRTVILGEPNAGKSSLLNRLVGTDRALVSAEPGTTRDFIEERINLGQHCIRLIDTAGLNPSPAPLEALGMRKTIERAEEADLYLVVIDPRRPIPTLPESIRSRISAANTVVVLNKSDLWSAEALRSIEGELAATFSVGCAYVPVSALNGDGVDQLTARIAALAEAHRVDFGDEVIAINARHAEALGRARTCLIEAIAKITDPEEIELLASDLRGALDAFGEIGGRIDNERMLDHLFASFCIGK
ncbi:MAG TPA: tRNA uridine-5-carboxymethylaminomethyl(34) synthesis GTPase MnmE [Opitutaceae bacterium]|nr:tRNA uridine-5-carboxymethylaminomethyl(34) synthesis GTPase MnmE [Opitutaceae bacterium]